MQRLFGFGGGGTGTSADPSTQQVKARDTSRGEADPKLQKKVSLINDAFNADELTGGDQSIKSINT